jgi:hypothetical protein
MEAKRDFARLANDAINAGHVAEALDATARNLHVVGGYHNPATVSFETCPRASCVAARVALQPKAEQEPDERQA